MRNRFDLKARFLSNLISKVNGLHLVHHALKNLVDRPSQIALADNSLLRQDVLVKQSLFDDVKHVDRVDRWTLQLNDCRVSTHRRSGHETLILKRGLDCQRGPQCARFCLVTWVIFEADLALLRVH